MNHHADSIADSESSSSKGLGGDASLLASFVDGIADIAYMKDPEGRYLLVNSAAARAHGRSAEQIVGLDDFALFPPDQAAKIAAQDRAALAAETPLTFEDEMQLQGKTLCLQTVKSVCRDAAGRVVGVVGVSREIGERKLLEAALRDRERELAESQRIARVGTWRYDCDSGLTTWSEEIYRIYGLDPREPALVYAEFLKRTDHTPGDLEFIAAFERLIHAGEPYTLDMELPSSRDSRCWVVARGEVEIWRDGKPAMLRGTVQEITERKRAERELALRENRYRSLVHASSQIVWTASASGDQMGVSPQWQAFTGQSDQEVLGFGWAAAIHPEDRDQAVAEWRAAVRAGSTVFSEQQVRRFDGVYRHMTVRAVPVRDDSGEIVEWVGTHTDVTEQRLAEEQGVAARERLQDVLDSITDGLAVLDRDWRYTYFNESGARMVGLRPEDIVGTRLGEIFGEIHSNAFGRAYLRAAETGESVHAEEYYGPPANKWFEGNCYPSKNGMTVYFRDITERKRTEEALRESEQRFRLLAEGLPELVWITDAVGSLTYLNNRFLTYCGIAEEATAGFNWQTILHPEEVERVNNAWTYSVLTGEPYLIELRLRRHDGSFRYFLARALPLLNANGEVERWVGSCADIHDQKLAEEALRRSEKLAATGRLAASIAHEINNPLASVVNSLYLALREPTLTPSVRELLQTADDELARVAHITTQTLRFHRQSKAASWSDLSEVMQSVLNLFRRRFATRRIEILSECAPDARVWCFEDELRQVFANLVSNALDATADGGRVRIRVRNACVDRIDGVRVTVADNGCGIRPEIRQRIFEPFFSTKDETGLGLGLWVSDGILRKHSARVSLRSNTAPDRHGTAFSLFFPQNGLKTTAERPPDSIGALLS
jgi:PAS domain S-box-containing protein